MRNVLPRFPYLDREDEDGALHLGLAYDVWAPITSIGADRSTHGKVSTDNDFRASWLGSLASSWRVEPDYRPWFERWSGGFTAPGDERAKFTLDARMLVGHGNSSATEVGLTVHHTWGVPMIPGSGLKGLTANYVENSFGPADRSVAPWLQEGSERKHGRYQGVQYDGVQILRAPGEVYGALFGAPDAEDNGPHRRDAQVAGAKGLVTFHDALFDPLSLSGRSPFAVDVLTVHQKEYYDAISRGADVIPQPNDFDNPNPVSFLTVRPRTQFLLAISGPAEWTSIAMRMLIAALSEWGAGGKTSSGYGRGASQKKLRPAGEGLKRFLDWLSEQEPLVKARAKTQPAVLKDMKTNWDAVLCGLALPERLAAAAAIKKVLKSGSVESERDAFLTKIWP